MATEARTEVAAAVVHGPGACSHIVRKDLDFDIAPMAEISSGHKLKDDPGHTQAQSQRVQERQCRKSKVP